MSGAAPERIPAKGGSGDRDRDYDELRRLLVAPELRRIEELHQRIDDPARRTQDVAQILAEAVSAARRPRVRRAIQPILEDAIRVSVRQNPAILADALFPVLGAVIRKSIEQALRNMMENFERAMQNSLSARGLGWRLEAWRTGRSFGEIALLRSLLYSVEQAFLIHRETGLLLCHAASSGAVVRDADMVSGMLTAIQDFVRDSFSGAERDLETMQVGDVGVWIQYGPKAILAGVVRGVAPRELHGVFEQALEQIHGDFAAALAGFSGDSTPFEPARPILERCLLGKRVGGQRSGFRYWVPAAIAALVLIAAALWLLSAWREQRRWSAYLTRLRSEQGIVLVSARRDSPGYRVEGLRDPLAADPAGLLAGTGLENRVSFAWEPFHSLQPPLSTQREIEERRQAIERRIVHFDTDKAAVGAQQWFVIDEAAFQVRALLAAAGSLGAAPAVEVVGTADSTGTAGRNAVLAKSRAGEVVMALVSRGVPRDRLRQVERVDQGDRAVFFHVVK